MTISAAGRNDDADDSDAFSQGSKFHDNEPAYLTASQRIMSSAMMKFVIQRGCDYTAVFVKSHLLRSHSGGSNATHDKCNIRKFAERRCEQNQIPPELCCAVISCGASHIALAFNVDDHLLHECNLTRDINDLHMRPIVSVVVGKRHDVIPSSDRLLRNHTPDMCDDFPVYTGKRDSGENPGSGVSLLNTLTMNNNQSSVHMLAHGAAENTNTHSTPREMTVQRWCKRFSRSVNRNFGFSTEQYVRQSVYWIQDLYTTCQRKNVPKPYAHSLVGCGIDHALSALEVPKWLATLYKTVI
ncbi:hypothetical protein DPMN_105420 [Dreissena polymorpha]|uniref:Uncharacterized protein n=2 Tax=Dreissena polymorpha TaxID=45954 RepID=A0A9D4K394_DREPO|nr:hypothetical protein DPMN_105420 [Dreissena polymorpha]